MKLFARVVVYKDWHDIASYELNGISIDQLPEQIQEILGSREGGNPLLIQIALWNEEMREEKIRENEK